MKFFSVSSLKQRKQADLLVLPFLQEKNEVVAAADFTQIKDIAAPIKEKDFKGKEGEICLLYGNEKLEPRIALLGLGQKDKLTVEQLRRAYGNLTKLCVQKNLSEINVVLPTSLALDKESMDRGVLEGLLLPNYAFTQLKNDTIKKDPIKLLSKVTFVGGDKLMDRRAAKYLTIMEGVYFARDLVNSNADDMTPEKLGQIAIAMAKKLPHTKATVFNKARILKEKMGLIYAVGRGSANPPVFIILEYKGNTSSKDHTVVVGKGVTFDTGGLNLKPGPSMDTMKCDMSGAATALATVMTAAKLGLKLNLTAVIPSVENAIGSLSYKPGDVYTSYSGKTVEVGDTDAEGRLILADALSYTVKHLHPTRIIDFATLTGAIHIALGFEASGLFSNQDALADSLVRAGYDTFERVWRMPMFEEYKEQLKSDIADIKNIGGRPAGSTTAAFFLQAFVGDVPWAHCDIASTAFLPDPKRYLPKYGTGVGVRLMIEFLEGL